MEETTPSSRLGGAVACGGAIEKVGRKGFPGMAIPGPSAGIDERLNQEQRTMNQEQRPSFFSGAANLEGIHDFLVGVAELFDQGLFDGKGEHGLVAIAVRDEVVIPLNGQLGHNASDSHAVDVGARFARGLRGIQELAKVLVERLLDVFLELDQRGGLIGGGVMQSRHVTLGDQFAAVDQTHSDAVGLIVHNEPAAVAVQFQSPR